MAQVWAAMEDVVLLLATTRLLFPPTAREELQSHSETCSFFWERLAQHNSLWCHRLKK